MDLDGSWRATPADDDLRRDGIGPDVDDSTWATLDVPGHWRSHPEFADHDGPLLYRRHFRSEPPSDGTRRWITFDGLFYQADVWIDGAYLGDPEGYFVPSAFEITDVASDTDEHVLAVEVACPVPSSSRSKRTITGVYQGWNGVDPTWNPGGLHTTVRVVDTGPVRIDRFRVLCRDADDVRAHVLLSTRLDSDAPRNVTVITSVDGETVATADHGLAAGGNEVAWSVDIEKPALWWPRALGEQPLTDIRIDIEIDGATSDTATRRTGLREVAWNKWVCSVNGERLFLKGANVLPTRMAPADATVEELRGDVELAVTTGLDAIRLHGHIARSEVYAAADEAGLLILQDFPLTSGYARSIRPQAVEQARAAVDLLGHHPSIVLWAAHDDPDGTDDVAGDPPGRLRRFASNQLPSWNRTVLDRWVKRSFERADPTRPCVPQSGALPHLPQLDGTDTHLSYGWGHGEARDLARVARRIPRLVRFVSEFGSQAVPDSADFIDHQHWPELDWDTLSVRHGAQRDRLEERLPPGDFGSFDEWRHATQLYQAELIRTHVETLRRLKYRPTGGFCMFALNDPAPLLSFSVLDHERRPKLGHRALVDACAPVVVIADRPPDLVEPGERLRLDVHLVNDLRHEVGPAVVDVVARWAGGEQQWSFGGDIPPDDCVRAGRIDLEVPRTLGVLAFDLTLTAGSITATNHYSSAIVAHPE